jgi:hypothetical protein
MIADNKRSRASWSPRLVQTLDSLHLKYREVGPDKLKRTRWRQSCAGEVKKQQSVFPDITQTEF